MIALVSGTQTFQMVLAGAIATAQGQWSATFEDLPPTSGPTSLGQIGSALGTSNNTTLVSVVGPLAGAPGLGRRQVMAFRYFNIDSASQTITLSIVDSSGPTTSICYRAILSSLDTLTYEDGVGFTVTTSTGAIKTQTPETSSALSAAVSAGTEALSVGTSASTLSSTAQSAGISAGTSASVLASSAGSTGVSAGTSASVLASTGGSTGASSGVSAGTSASVLGSTAVSTITSRVSSNGG